MHSTAEKMWVLAFMWMLLWQTLLIHTHNCRPSTHHGSAIPIGGIIFPQMDNMSHQIKKYHPRMHCKIWQRAQGFELAYKLSGSHSYWAFMRSNGTPDQTEVLPANVQDPKDALQCPNVLVPGTTGRLRGALFWVAVQCAVCVTVWSALLLRNWQAMTIGLFPALYCFNTSNHPSYPEITRAD